MADKPVGRHSPTVGDFSRGKKKGIVRHYPYFGTIKIHYRAGSRFCEPDGLNVKSNWTLTGVKAV